ncbi:MAG: ergothioneine biosynthesis protein EgtB [Panacagrimonas sp.]
MADDFIRVRQASEQLVAPLSAEDAALQSMPDCSPSKWHLAHTTWFFEQFVLGRDASYVPVNAGWDYLFNSYYQSVGPMHARPQRGMLSRPCLAEVIDYRHAVDERVQSLLAQDHSPQTTELVTLGLHHEQQHQELLLTDIKHLFSLNPLKPAYQASKRRNIPALDVALKFISRPHGKTRIGHRGGGFSFDCETPDHEVLLQPHALANRPINNGEFREFVRDGGYQDVSLWLSAAWDTVQNNGWNRPFYWSQDLQREFTLCGEVEIDPLAPVSHVSFFEADAFARWASARLPTEAELECVANESCVSGHFADHGRFHPMPPSANGEILQLFGDVWEWTASPFVSYPGYQPAAGALGEYNGKFMCGQYVLRGGSCVTPAGHLRATYRNFFHPPDRWQFSGIRLAKDQ